MTIILAVCVPLAFVAGGFVAYKGVHLGLRWQVEVRQERPPTMETPKNPFDAIKESRQEKEQVNLLNEWVNGADEG